MANSLRAKISKLRHDGKISDSEYQELIKKLDGHDAMVREDAFEELVLAINQNLPYDICDGREAIDEIVLIAEQLKEKNE